MRTVLPQPRYLNQNLNKMGLCTYFSSELLLFQGFYLSHTQSSRHTETRGLNQRMSNSSPLISVSLLWLIHIQPIGSNRRDAIGREFYLRLDGLVTQNFFSPNNIWLWVTWQQESGGFCLRGNVGTTWPSLSFLSSHSKCLQMVNSHADNECSSLLRHSANRFPIKGIP